jgi:predicted transcriptional regulator
MEPKQQVRSLDDVLYHLYVVRSIEKGLADADADRVIPHTEVAEALRRRWQVGSDE